MAFREDHEAALARADALERELAAKEKELSRARQELVNRPELAAPVHAHATPTPWRRPLPFIALTLALTVVAVCWIALRTADSPVMEPSPAAPLARVSCTLVTEPPGATVYRRCRNSTAASLNHEMARHDTADIQLPRASSWTEVPLGTTPLTLDADTWNSAPLGCEGLFAKLEGDSGIPISSPATAQGCDTRTITLRAP